MADAHSTAARLRTGASGEEEEEDNAEEGEEEVEKEEEDANTLPPLDSPSSAFTRSMNICAVTSAPLLGRPAYTAVGRTTAASTQ